jgi:hypothetical protein
MTDLSPEEIRRRSRAESVRGLLEYARRQAVEREAAEPAEPIAKPTSTSEAARALLAALGYRVASKSL